MDPLLGNSSQRSVDKEVYQHPLFYQFIGLINYPADIFLDVGVFPVSPVDSFNLLPVVRQKGRFFPV